MNSPRQVIFILSFFLSAGAFAQKLEVSAKGEPVNVYEFNKANKTFPDPRVTFFNSRAKKAYTLYDFVDQKLIAGTWNDYMNLSSVTGITGFGQPGTSSHAGIELFASVEGKNFVFFTSEVPKSNEVTLYAMQLGDDLEVLGSPIVLERYTDIKTYGRTIAVVVSDDKKHFLIVRIYKRKNNTEPQKAECKVINSDFSQVWKNEFSFENGTRDVEFRNARLDENGNMLLLVAIATNNPFYEDNLNFTDVVYTYFHKSGNFKMLETGLAEGTNFGVSIEVKGSTVFVAGLNRQKKSVNYFIQRLNTDFETLERLTYNPMPENFFKKANWKINEVGFWRVTDILPLDNGLWVVAIESKVINGARFLSFDTYLMAFTESGEHKWSYVIRKLQNFTESVKVGIHYISAGNKIFATYNDVNINLKRDVSQKAFITDAAYPYVITVQEIDDKGNGKKYALMEGKENEGTTINIPESHKIDNTSSYSTLEYYASRISYKRNIVITVK
ncbi:MAG: hypothetical protein WDO15_05415 [Bacteroidota bacterium]